MVLMTGDVRIEYRGRGVGFGLDSSGNFLAFPTLESSTPDNQKRQYEPLVEIGQIERMRDGRFIPGVYVNPTAEAIAAGVTPNNTHHYPVILIDGFDISLSNGVQTPKVLARCGAYHKRNDIVKGMKWVCQTHPYEDDESVLNRGTPEEITIMNNTPRINGHSKFGGQKNVLAGSYKFDTDENIVGVWPVDLLENGKGKMITTYDGKPTTREERLSPTFWDLRNSKLPDNPIRDVKIVGETTYDICKNIFGTMKPAYAVSAAVARHVDDQWELQVINANGIEKSAVVKI